MCDRFVSENVLKKMFTLIFVPVKRFSWQSLGELDKLEAERERNGTGYGRKI